MGNDTWLRLKNGKKIMVRKILFTDVIDRHEFFVRLSMAQVGMVHTIDEIEIHTHETHDKIHDFLRNNRGLWLVTLNTHKKIVAEIDITVNNLTRVRHNGKLTIGILPEYQRLGLGTHLMEQALLWAQNHKLLRIELSVFANNIPAQLLYKKFDFVVEGVRKGFLHHEDGSFEDDWLMAKYIEPI